MTKTNLRYLAVAVALTCCGMTSAQNLRSAYFLDGYTYGHRLNPAKDYDRKGYVSVPVVGNVSYGMLGNMSLSDVLLDNSGKLVTFLNSDIPSSVALAGFTQDESNYSRLDMNTDILSFGFHAWGGFNTFNVSLRANVGFDAPYDFFRVAKEQDNLDVTRNYDLSGIKLNLTSWAEIGFGHSHKVADAWRVGGRLKVLLGLGRAKLNVSDARLNYDSGSSASPIDDKWNLSTDATAEVSLKGFTWGDTETKEYAQGGTYEQVNFNNLGIEGYGINGWGLGFDLGAEWDLGKQGWLDGMTVSASLLDLGFISWNQTHCAYNDGKEVNYVATDGANGDAMRISDLLAIQDGGTKKVTSMLGATLNVGVEYQMPFYKKLSAGFLSTTRIQGAYSWNEERISATVSPIKWLEASVNVGFGTMGTSFGWVANIHPRGFNLFVGMDHLMGSFSKQGVPLNSNTNVTVGINIPFGKSTIN